MVSAYYSTFSISLCSNHGEKSITLEAISTLHMTWHIVLFIYTPTPYCYIEKEIVTFSFARSGALTQRNAQNTIYQGIVLAPVLQLSIVSEDCPCTTLLS